MTPRVAAECMALCGPRLPIGLPAVIQGMIATKGLFIGEKESCFNLMLLQNLRISSALCMPPVSRVRYTGFLQLAGACDSALTGHSWTPTLMQMPTRALVGFAKKLEKIRPIMQIDPMG